MWWEEGELVVIMFQPQSSAERVPEAAPGSVGPPERRKRARGWDQPRAPARPLGGEVAAVDVKALQYCADTPLSAGEAR